ncbi:hypothetical protein [Ketogulonicigenium robustum]|uniref:hypothetical protein n=1 Tax=Ketogulonicigenium robustum TaxID=92947 RepID=UPI001C30CF10|nr:hypothetical protein [Ketogulonicigenium robustum]
MADVLPQGCTLSGWISPAVADGVPARALPDSGAAVLGVYPVSDNTPPAGREDPLVPVMVEVGAAQDGWFQIVAASDGDNDDARPLPPNTGWVPADSVRFAIQSARGYAQPDTSSAQLVDLGDDWATDLGAVDQVLSCAGDWVQIDYRQTLKRAANDALVDITPHTQTRAWFRGVCGNPMTTCDMRSVDR